VRASQIPDDVQLLQQLLGQGFLIGTPAQDYDDSYCLNYARQRGGYIISNDLYRYSLSSSLSLLVMILSSYPP
jgi:hypothetical protein